MSNKVIVALDYTSLAEAQECITELGDTIKYYKVGMELFYAAGPYILTYLKSINAKIFLDLKLMDIPNTVSHACSVLTSLGIDMLNIHALGGRNMMEETVKAVHETAERLSIMPPKLLAVTILTSVDDKQYSELNYSKSIKDQVISLAKLAKNCGMDGVVASPKEAEIIREVCGPNFLIVTPGVRPAGSDMNDQSRVATPRMAIKNGATHIVVGRPITKAANRKEAAEKINAEVENVE